MFAFMTPIFTLKKHLQSSLESFIYLKFPLNLYLVPIIVNRESLLGLGGGCGGQKQKIDFKYRNKIFKKRIGIIGKYIHIWKRLKCVKLLTTCPLKFAHLYFRIEHTTMRVFSDKISWKA